MARLDKLFVRETLFPEAPEWLRSAFDGMPQDRYIPEGYRFRRLSRFHLRNGQRTLLPAGPYTQDTNRGRNTYMGEVPRVFEGIEQQVLDLPQFTRMIDGFLEAAGGRDGELLLNVHLIRNVCSAGHPGYPAPEGVHRDGFDVVGILCVAQQNAVGALTELFEPGVAEPLFQAQLEPGELLLLDDTRLLHYTSPIEAQGADSGYRDVIIFTVNHTGTPNGHEAEPEEAE